jgi:hypothetical protein
VQLCNTKQVLPGKRLIAMKRNPTEKYLKEASSLTKKEAEYLFMRMGGKLGRRIDDNKVIPLEALAIQLEIEDENRNEWRERFAEIKARYDKL